MGGSCAGQQQSNGTTTSSAKRVIANSSVGRGGRAAATTLNPHDASLTLSGAPAPAPRQVRPVPAAPINANEPGLSPLDRAIAKLDAERKAVRETPGGVGGGFAKPADDWKTVPAYDSCTAHMIVDGVYLGGQEAACDRASLMKNGVKYILNVSAEVDCFFETDHPSVFIYKRMKIADDRSSDIMDSMLDAIAFIELARRNNSGILVHCVAGMSRSASMVMAYIMKTHGITLLDTYWMVKKARYTASPNPSFMEQLVRYERKLRAVASIDPTVYEKRRFIDPFWPEHMQKDEDFYRSH
jgi:hypothetical protein